SAEKIRIRFFWNCDWISSKKSDVNARHSATACCRGAGAQRYVSSDFTARGAITLAGPMSQPTLQPVTRNVFPADDNVKVCSNISGKLAMDTCGRSWLTRCS